MEKKLHLEAQTYDGVMDANDIDHALHEIRQMVLVAIKAQESLIRSGADPATFQLPEADVDMLCFSIFDLKDRVEALKDGLFKRGECD